MMHELTEKYTSPKSYDQIKRKFILTGELDTRYFMASLK